MRFPFWWSNSFFFFFCFKQRISKSYFWVIGCKICTNYLQNMSCHSQPLCMMSLITWHNKVFKMRGAWYSQLCPIWEIYMLCSQTQSSNIHACTVNMNWWVLNCKACYPAQNSISHRYLILPFIRSSKRLDVGKISYFAQFSILPLGIKFNFRPKVCSEKEKKINIRFLSRGGSVTHLKEGDVGRWGETD